MFGTIRKHQTWLWAVIITLTIISFVVFFSPYSKMNEGGQANYGSINGKKVSQDDYMQAQREVYLRYLFMSGRWPDEDARRRGFEPMRETYNWLLLTRKQEELGIKVGDQVAARTGRELLQAFERQGITDVTTFTKQVLEPQRFSLQDFERFVKHHIGLQQLMNLVGSGGSLITPQEARTLYVRENQPIASQVALFSASNYLSKVTVTPEAVSQYYSNYLANYRIPDRIQVVYVKFGVTNFLEQAEAELSRSNLNEIVEANLQRMGTNYFGGAKTPEEAKAKIREEIIRTRAEADARRHANEFARPLFEKEQPSVADLEKAAAAQNLQRVITPPFSRESSPEGMQVGEDFMRTAFSLNAENPFGQPYRGFDGTYVYALYKTIPSEIPPLAQIRARVEEDYKMNQAATLARQAGTSFHTTVTNGLAQGKSFEEISKSADVKAIEVPEFSLSTRILEGDIEERVPLNLLKQLAFSTEPGKASHFQPTREGGVILYVKTRLPVDENKMKEEMPDFLTYLRRQRADEAFQAWFRKEAEKGLRDTPLAQESAQGKS